jgi:hypothetical protein
MPTLDELVSAYHTLTPSEQKSFLRKVSPRGAHPILTRDEIVTALRALSPSDQKAVRDEVWPRKYGPEKSDRRLVRRVTRDVLWEMMTVNGKPFYNWEMKLTPKQVDALPVDTWKVTPEGEAEFTRGGQEAFEAWVTTRRNKLKEWLTLQMKRLLNLVDQRINPDSKRGAQRKNTRKGDFLRDVRAAKDEFFMGWYGLPWEGIPSALRDKRQPAFQGNPTLYEKGQYEWLYPPILRAS